MPKRVVVKTPGTTRTRSSRRVEQLLTETERSLHRDVGEHCVGILAAEADELLNLTGDLSGRGPLALERKAESKRE
jgi:hypothetical protein